MAASAAPAPPPHALILPYPAQGHVIPFMELAHRFLDRGFAVTFVNTEFNHRRLAAADAGNGATNWTGSSSAAGGGRLRLVAVADGMDDAGDRGNLVLLNAAMQEAIPPQLEALLDGEEEAAGEGLGKVTCVVVDFGMSFALDVVKRRGIKSAALWPASAGVLSAMVNAEKLIRDGVIDDDGARVQEHQEKEQARTNTSETHTTHAELRATTEHTSFQHRRHAAGTEEGELTTHQSHQLEQPC